ncbi:MAG: hypothetical protein ACJAVX_003056 [Pseudoalteromonas rhizosphaerae]|uniref:hypothetical protein n=1 Tax=Pseudoalteromonas rhizosphaerae TaxID=2518973 RepID=UPI0039E3B1FE
MDTNTENKACNCFTETLNRVKEHLTEQGKIPADAIDVSFGWQGQTYMLSGGQYAPVNPKIEVKFRAAKKSGGHARNLTKNELLIAASHCCYCGREYQRNNG